MIKVSNSLNIDTIIATWLASSNYSGNGLGKTISATTLLRPLQQQYLQYQLMNNTGIGDSVIDISTLLKSRVGTALHEAIQQAWEDDDLRVQGLTNLGLNPERYAVNPLVRQPGITNLIFERRASRLLDGWTITGQFDLVCNGCVHDFKSTSVYTYMNKTKEEDYIKQGSIYRWLNPDLIKGDVLTIHYIFTDWNKNLVATEGYPPHPFVSISLPLMSLSATEEFIRGKLKALDNCIEQGFAPECSEEELLCKTVYQYFGSNDAKKASKNFDSALEAHQYCASKGKGYVAKKVGEPKACSWCNCRGCCNQYQKLKIQGLIKD